MQCVVRLIEYTRPGRRGADITVHSIFDLEQDSADKVIGWLKDNCTNPEAVEKARELLTVIKPDTHHTIRWTNEFGLNFITLATHPKQEN
jgi:hypothetical protein